MPAPDQTLATFRALQFAIEALLDKPMDWECQLAVVDARARMAIVLGAPTMVEIRAAERAAAKPGLVKVETAERELEGAAE